MGTVASFLGINRPGCNTDQSPPSGAKIRTAWSLTPIHHILSWLKPKRVKESLSTPLSYMEVSNKFHAPAALPSRNNPVPIEYVAVLAPELVWTFWRREKSNLPLPRSEPRTIQREDSLYNDYTAMMWLSLHIHSADHVSSLQWLTGGPTG